MDLWYYGTSQGGVLLQTEEILSMSLDIGEQMLISGAEISRVEDSVRRILMTYQMRRADVFTITSSIVVTATDAAGRVTTQTRRIRKYATNLDKLHKLNDLSRKICAEKPDLVYIRAQLEKIEAEKPYPFFVECLAFALIGGAFSLFFGGNAQDALVAALMGAVLKLVVYGLTRAEVNMVFANVLSSFTLCSLTILCVAIGFGAHADKIIIGNIMLLIPGIAMTNSIRDIISGDIMAGILRFCEASVVAIGIAAGYILAALLLGGLL